MPFKIGDSVIHKSDKKPRKMVIVDMAFKQFPPLSPHSELANTGQVPEGSYYCTWISGAKKGAGYFSKAELLAQPETK